MLYNVIILKSRELERDIASDSIPKFEEIKKLLEYILYTSQNIPFNIEQFDNLYTLFRKWKTLINMYYPNSYNESIDNTYSVYEDIEDIEEYDFNDVSRLLIKRSDNDVIKYNKFDLLTKLVDPFLDIKTDIKIMDYEFFSKYSVLETLNEATREFKKSNLEKAYQLNIQAIENLKEIPILNDLHLYFYSWSLHNLGNIELVKSNYKRASYYYRDSLTLKMQISSLPPIHVYATKLKFLTANMYQQNMNDNHDDLLSFYFELDNIQETTMDNPNWFNSIKLEASYNLARSFFYKRNYNLANQYFDIAVKEGEKVHDPIGILRSQVSKIFTSYNPDEELERVVQSIKTLKQKYKCDPYLISLLNDNNIKEWQLINSEYSKKIVTVFENNGITKKVFIHQIEDV